MEKHAHLDQHRYYIVLEGQGQVWIDTQQQEIGYGKVIWIPTGHSHRIQNAGKTTLVLLVGIVHLKSD